MTIRIKNNFNAKMVENKVRAAIGLYADTAAKKMETEAKKNKPWENRTSNAVNSILGDFNWQGNRAVITLSGNVDYFVFLELAHGKKYSILAPTVYQYASEVLKGYQKLVK